MKNFFKQHITILATGLTLITLGVPGYVRAGGTVKSSSDNWGKEIGSWGIGGTFASHKHMCGKGLGEYTSQCFQKWEELSKDYRMQRKSLSQELRGDEGKAGKVLPMVAELHKIWKRTNIYYPLRMQNIQAMEKENMTQFKARGLKMGDKKVIRKMEKLRKARERLASDMDRWKDNETKFKSGLKRAGYEEWTINTYAEEEKTRKQAEANAQKLKDDHNQSLGQMSADLETNPYGPFSSEADQSLGPDAEDSAGNTDSEN